MRMRNGIIELDFFCSYLADKTPTVSLATDRSSCEYSLVLRSV